VILRTDRLTLRPFRSDDESAFERFANHEDYLRFLGDDHPIPRDFVRNNVAADGAWVIEFDGAVVGSVFLDDELACLLDPAVHDKGIGVEAARAVIEDGFRRRGIEVVVARADPANTASVRGLVRLGFAVSGDGRYILRRTGGGEATR
jgi:RimJ/RimL family protein N-acetyltransferase